LGKRGHVHNNYVVNYPGPGTYSVPSFCDKILKRYATLKGTRTYAGPADYNNVKVRRKRKRKRRKGYQSARVSKSNRNVGL